jgi:hypothetical protein
MTGEKGSEDDENSMKYLLVRLLYINDILFVDMFSSLIYL